MYDFVRVPDRPADSFLPDADRYFKSELRWVDGAIDTVLAAPDQPEQAETANAILPLFLRVCRNGADASVRAFYAKILDQRTLGYIDEFLPLVVSAARADRRLLPHLEEVGLWLATRSPDREPVKLGIALLGLLSGDRHASLFETFAVHDEFTLFAMVAIRRSNIEPEPVLWNLAKKVHGYGRIWLVRALSETERRSIKAWMLREGYRNTIMDQYLAFTCAVTGNLHLALKESVADDELIAAAGDILEALIEGGPAEDIRDYDAGVTAVQQYLRLVRDLKSRALRQFFVLNAIAEFVKADREDWEDLEAIGWTIPVREQIRVQAEALIQPSPWLAQINEGLQSPDSTIFQPAARAADILGIDTWPARFARQRSGADDQWYNLMQTDDPARIDRTIELAERILPLSTIATGPDTQLLPHENQAAHSALDFLLQDVVRFPGRGWPLIRVGLQSPVVRNRNMALRALGAWDRQTWPDDATPLLQAAIRAEPVDETRTDMNELLEGTK